MRGANQGPTRSGVTYMPILFAIASFVMTEMTFSAVLAILY